MVPLYRILLVLTCFLLATSAVAQELELPVEPIGNVPGSVKRALFEAQTLRNEQRYAEAVDVLRKCLERNRQFDVHALRFHLGNALVLAGRAADAKSHYEACVEQNASSVQGWFQLARTCYEISDYARAASAFETLMPLLPKPNAVIVFYAGVANYMDEQSARAFALLSQLVGGAFGPPTVEWCKAYVAAAYAAGRAEETQSVLRNLVDLEPGNPDAWYLLYQCAGMSEDYEQAAMALTVVDYIKPLPARELVQLGDLHMQIDVPAKAIPYYQRAMIQDSEDASHDLRARLAAAYLSAHDHDGALQFLQGALATDATAPLWSFLGDALYAREKFEEALAAFQQSDDLDQGDGRSLLMMGYCAYRLDRQKEAHSHLTAASLFDAQREKAKRLLSSVDRN